MLIVGLIVLLVLLLVVISLCYNIVRQVDEFGGIPFGGRSHHRGHRYGGHHSGYSRGYYPYHGFRYHPSYYYPSDYVDPYWYYYPYWKYNQGTGDLSVKIDDTLHGPNYMISNMDKKKKIKEEAEKIAKEATEILNKINDEENF